MSLAQFWHSHIAFSIDALSSEDVLESNRGPPDAAAVMWAATPRLMDLLASLCGPLVGALQAGFEQRKPTRFAKASFVALEKSSRGIWFTGG